MALRGLLYQPEKLDPGEVNASTTGAVSDAIIKSDRRSVC